jgi:hypothetical protein
MIRSHYFVLIVVVTIGAVATWNLYAQQEQPEGDKPYTPTKLEWLALLLNVEQKGEGEIQIVFRPHREKKNTIKAQVVHAPQADKSLVKAHVTIAKRSVARISQQHGWDWVQVDVQVAELVPALMP